MISAFQYYFPNVLDNINQKHLEQKKPRIELDNIIQITKTIQEPKTSEVELMIEDKFIGKIIGRGGCNIDEIRKNTNAKIVIYRKLYDTPNAERVSGQGTKRRIIISGEIDCVENAKNTIFEITN